MPDAAKWIGITDSGHPLVMAEGGCAHFYPGQRRLLNSRTCWYCRYADFRKNTALMLAQSVCRCPGNHVTVVPGSENEALERAEGPV